MFEDQEAVATIAVKNLQRGKKFYQGTLGMQPFDGEEPGVLTLKSGPSKVFVYESQFAGTNQATALTWIVDDVDGTVRDLKTKGVSFEHYDLPEMKREGDVHVAGDMRAAWFKDPDGNILALVSG
jgi:catechol 2,3-dioxygenase-like lactoylglutathione lyase family enzyme